MKTINSKLISAAIIKVSTCALIEVDLSKFSVQSRKRKRSLSYSFNDIGPGLSRIEYDLENRCAIIHFSSEILGDDCNQHICFGTINKLVEEINKYGIVRIDPWLFIKHSTVLLWGFESGLEISINDSVRHESTQNMGIKFGNLLDSQSGINLALAELTFSLNKDDCPQIDSS